MKKIFACLLTVCLCSAGFAAPASAAASEKAAVTIADGVNVTRWDNFLVVYKDIAATGQNEWGHNIVVNADSQVVRILEGGDAAGKNLAVPVGGMVVSATGEKAEWLKDNIAIGDYVIYDDMTGRVMASRRKGLRPDLFRRADRHGFQRRAVRGYAGRVRPWGDDADERIRL